MNFAQRAYHVAVKSPQGKQGQHVSSSMPPDDADKFQGFGIQFIYWTALPAPLALQTSAANNTSDSPKPYLTLSNHLSCRPNECHSVVCSSWQQSLLCCLCWEKLCTLHSAPRALKNSAASRMSECIMAMTSQCQSLMTHLCWGAGPVQGEPALPEGCTRRPCQRLHRLESCAQASEGGGRG